MKKTVKCTVTVLSIIAILLCVFLVASAADAEEIALIDLNTEWRYLDDNTDPAAGLGSLTAWTAPGFDDSQWKTGIGSFGSKNGSLEAVNKQTPKVLLDLFMDDGTTCIPTYFFRTTFTVTDIDKYNILSIKAYADDAVVIYINGVAIRDSRATVKTNTNLYYSSGEWEQTFFINLDELDVLVEGENTVAVQLHNNQKASTDIYFGIHSMSLSCQSSALIVAEQVVLGIGADETQRSLSWISNTSSSAEVRLAKAADVKNGVFPTEYASFAATSTPCTNLVARYSNEATMTGLEPNTEYAYAIAVGDAVSKIYYFATDKEGDFEFVFVGDSQLSKQSHGTSWQDTVRKIIDRFDNEILVSSGDHVSSPDSEVQYSYFLIDELSSIAFAPSVGPSHDSDSASYEDHFAIPNKSTAYGANTTSANYWYTYNNTLFMHLNMSDRSASTNGEHENFIREAMAQNPNVNWNIVIMHVSVFSAGMHADPEYKHYEGEIGKLRPALAEMFSRVGVDAVLSGHDHSYVRTHMMNGTEISDDELSNGNTSVYDPEGVLYICASSSTGSGFYSKTIDEDFIAAENYEKRKSAIKVDVTEDSLRFTAYFLDDFSVFDTFAIYKTPHICSVRYVERVEPTCINSGKEAYYICQCNTAYEDEEATKAIFNISTYGVLSYLGHDFAEATCTEPKRCIRQGCGQTIGEPLSHIYDNEKDADCNICGDVRQVEKDKRGEALIIASATVAAVSLTGGGLVAYKLIKRKKVN